jgi:PKD repeat protein
MAENEPAPAKGKGWLKAIVGTVGGLLSGAVAMYATAAFNEVVKPAKPIANFKYDAKGNNVTFQNLSGTSQGWWDFGDGSGLEPVAGRKLVTHTYARSGDYSVKLSLQNILGEEAERSVTVHVDPAGTTTANGPPRVTSLEAEPVSPGGYAPATFKVVTKVQNAQLCVLDFGDDRPPEVLAEATAERLVTFKEPGGHVVKLVAINGKRLDTKSEIVNVEEAPTGTVSAMLTISDTASRAVSQQQGIELHADSPQTASDGYTITAVSIPATKQSLAVNGQTEVDLDPDAFGLKYARNLKLQLVDGGKAVQFTGEPGKDWRGREEPLKPVLLLLTEQARLAVKQDGLTSTTTLAMPAGKPTTADVAMPGVPSDWVDVKRQARLKMLDGDKVLWEGVLPSSVSFAVGKRICLLNVTAADGKVHLDLRDATPAGTPPAAN